MRTLEPLISLARDRGADDTTRLRCAVAFANWPARRAGEMVTAGVVPVVAGVPSIRTAKRISYIVLEHFAILAVIQDRAGHGWNGA